MAKKEQKQARSTATENAARVSGREGTAVAGLSEERGISKGRQTSTFEPAKSGYEQAQVTGGYNPEELTKLRATGGYDPEALAGLRAKASTGGYDPAQLAKLRTAGEGFIGSGGFDPTNSDKIVKGYSEFANTGGFNSASMGDFRRRATSSVPSVYNVLGAEAQRRRSLTGGLGTGGDISQMARQVGQESAKANTNAEAALNEQINQNKLAGLGGLGGFETSVAGGRRAALGQLSSTEGDVAGKSLSAGLGLEGDIAAGRRGIESNVASGRLAGAGGLSHLYDTSTGEVSDMGRQVLAHFGLEDASHDQQVQVLTQLANTPGILDNILRIGTMAGGVLGGVGSIMK